MRLLSVLTTYPPSTGGAPLHQQRIGVSVRDKRRMLPYVPISSLLMEVALPPMAAILERDVRPYAMQADLVPTVRSGREGLRFAALQAAHQPDIPFVLPPVPARHWMTGILWNWASSIKHAEANVPGSASVAPDNLALACYHCLCPLHSGLTGGRVEKCALKCLSVLRMGTGARVRNATMGQYLQALLLIHVTYSQRKGPQHERRTL